jgi:hypothetical protein
MVESTRTVFVPRVQRLWDRSGVFDGAHIQLSVRRPENILAVWHVRKDGRYGKLSGTTEEKIESLKRAGILTAKGKLSKRYKSWGAKISRTQVFEDVDA